jgi:hypothetical protein
MEPSAALPETCSAPAEQMVDDNSIEPPEDHSVGPRKRLSFSFSHFVDIFIFLSFFLLNFCFICRVIGPAMPSAELLAAAAKLTEAQTEFRY